MENKTVIHQLKTWPQYFQAILRGDKDFEVRKNDRNYQCGDELLLREYDPQNGTTTGRILHRKVKYILHGDQFGIEAGFCIMGLDTV